MIDNYTKVILTVIAVSTSFLALQGSGVVPSATASSEIQKVRICGEPHVCAKVRGGRLIVYSDSN